MPGVRLVEAVAVNHGALLLADQVVFAPPALILIVWDGGADPNPGLKIRLGGVMESSAT